MDNISLSSFKVWIFSNDDVISLFTFISKFAFGLRAIFYNLVLWFKPFFCYFKLACFLVESGCVFYRTLRTFFDDFCFTCSKIWVVSVFSIISKFDFFNNCFSTNYYYPIFFFGDSLSSLCWVSNWLRVFNLLSNSYFFFSWFTFFFNNLAASVEIFVINYLGFERNFSFDGFSYFAFCFFWSFWSWRFWFFLTNPNLMRYRFSCNFILCNRLSRYAIFDSNCRRNRAFSRYAFLIFDNLPGF